MSNIYSVDFELSNSAHGSIADGDTTGLKITGDHSIECWVKPEAGTDTAGQLIAGKADASGNGGYQMSLNGTTNKVIVTIDEGAAGADISQAITTGTVPDGAWMHLAYTYDASAGQIAVYFNGTAQALDTDATAATSVNDNSEPFCVASNAGGGNYYDGRIDELRAWSDVRTATEIQTFDNREIGPGAANLVGYWRFNNNALDMTTNNNDLTVSGTPTYSSSDVPFRGSSGMTMVM